MDPLISDDSSSPAPATSSTGAPPATGSAGTSARTSAGTSAGTLPKTSNRTLPKTSARTSALLIVDMQVGVMAGCVDADGTLARAQAAVERARNAGIAVIWVQDEQDFARHSSGWELAAPLAPRAGEHLIFKAYRDAFAATELAEVLTAAGVDRLLIAGAQSDFCVRTAAQSAAARGYDVTLVSDAHTTVDARLGDHTIAGADIIAHTNQYFAGLRYPGQTFAAAPHDTVAM